MRCDILQQAGAVGWPEIPEGHVTDPGLHVGLSENAVALGRRGALVSLRVGQVLVFDEGGHRHRALRAAPKLGHYLADVPLDAILHCGISYAVVFIESRPFTRRLTELAGDSADNVLRQIQDDLLQNPERGSIVKGLGGIRKARMSNPARGKESVEATVICICTWSTGHTFTCSFCWIRASKKT